ncbi:MAG: sarcinarray family MAST domain-containing protein [Halobacteria archaeon]
MLRGVIPIILLIVLSVVGHAASNEYGEVVAYFNGKTVPPLEKASLTVGQIFELKVDISMKRQGDVVLALTSPGSTDDRQPYKTIEGPSQFGKSFRSGLRDAGERFELRWRLQPTGAWTGGTAPINLYVGFENPKPPYERFPLEFAIASIYIEPSGGAPAQPPIGTPRQPGFELLAALVSMGLVAIVAKRFA